MEQHQEPITGLPENAFRPLTSGEKYHPLMSPHKKYKEVNFTYQQKQNEYLDLLLSIKNPKK